jgi:hypothetical protein
MRWAALAAAVALSWAVLTGGLYETTTANDHNSGLTIIVRTNKMTGQVCTMFLPNDDKWACP